MGFEAEISYRKRRVRVGVAQALDDSIRQARRVRGFAPCAGVDLQDLHGLPPSGRVEREANIFVAWMGQKPSKWITLFQMSNNPGRHQGCCKRVSSKGS